MNHLWVIKCEKELPDEENCPLKDNKTMTYCDFWVRCVWAEGKICRGCPKHKKPVNYRAQHQSIGHIGKVNVTDDLAPARGVLFGLLLSVIIWVVCIVAWVML